MTDQTEEIVDITKLLSRGQTPEDIKEKCFNLCQQYLSGVWLSLTIDEITVQRLTGGLTNQLYYCAVNEDKQISESKEPQEVAILFYGPRNGITDHEGRLKDSIVALLVSENGLGPKIYGLFESGQILKYYKHKSFRSDEQKDRKLVESVAQKIARIHAMEVPIERTGNSLIEYFHNTYQMAKETFDLKSLIEESNSQTLKNFDIEKELQWIKKVILDSNSPIVFTHGDVRGSNIMITESDGIVLCDFELSTYGYRGFDLGTLFCEWARSWGQWDDPHQFPSDETFKIFIDSYIEESVKLKGRQFGEDIRNSFKNILKEIKVFTLVGYLWITVFLLAKNESIFPTVPFSKHELMVPTEKLYKNAYRVCKQTLLNQKLIEPTL